MGVYVPASSEARQRHLKKYAAAQTEAVALGDANKLPLPPPPYQNRMPSDA